MQVRTMQILMDPDDRVVVYPVPANREFVVSCGPLSLAFASDDEAWHWAHSVMRAIDARRPQVLHPFFSCESGKSDIPTWTPRPPGSSAA